MAAVDDNAPDEVIAAPSPPRVPIQWGFFAVTLTLAALLVLSAGSSFFAARRLTDVIVQGEGEALWHDLREGLPRRRPPTADELAALLAAHTPAGLRYLAIHAADRDAPLAATAAPTYTELPDIRAHLGRDGRARIKRPLGPPPRRPPDAGPPPHPDGPPPPHPDGPPPPHAGPPPHLDGPPPPHPDGPPPPHAGPPPPHPDGPHAGPPPHADPPHAPSAIDPATRPGPPDDVPSAVDPATRPGPLHLVLEFEPQAAAALLARARRDLLVSLAVAVALLVSAAIFHRLQRRARIAEAGLLERRHLAALGEMSAILAHEIRNPLASLKGHAQLLEEQLAGDERRRAKARRIVDEAVRLERLTTSLLDFVRAGQISRTRSDPRALARRVVDITDPSRVTVDDAAAPDTWPFDPTRVEQALVNLLRNALQASSDTPVQLIVQPEDGGLAFIVADRGPGVPVGLQGRLFEPFVTGRTQGTGLGLAVVRRVAELHGGRVTALSRTGGGSSFRVWLPPGPETPPAPETP